MKVCKPQAVQKDIDKKPEPIKNRREIRFLIGETALLNR
jgi:hypothetical protein